LGHSISQLIHLHWPDLCLSAYTVKLFTFVGTKFHGLMTMDMFVDTGICGFRIIRHKTKVNKYFVGVLNSWIALIPMKNTKLNV